MEVGSVVYISSGGINMTVEKIVSDELIECIWWCDGKYHTGRFKKNILKTKS